MIDWLTQIDPKRVFLRFGDDIWTYGDARSQVEVRISPHHRVVRPSLDPGSVFDVLAGLAGGGVTVLGPGHGPSDATDADLVVFTSGSTGPPRGVRLTKSNLAAAASASAMHLGHDAEDDWLLAMPLHHVGGLSILVRQAFTGGSVSLLPEFDAQGYAAALGGAPTMASVVPTMLRRLVPFGPFTGLRAVLVGGGPIPDGLLDEAVSAGLPVLPTYGMSETFGQVATLRPGERVERKAHPLPGIELRIEDDGRIAVRGAQVSPGYAGEPDRDEPWFVTGDLGELDEDGALRVDGRADTVIVTGGENVSPEQVEAALRGHQGVEEVVVFGVADDEWGHVVVGLYEGTAAAEELLTHARRHLRPYMVPKRLRRVERIPRTSIGKPDREAVRASGLGGGD